MKEKNKDISAEKEQPPFFSSWNQVYLLVFSFLIFQIVLFYLFTQYFS